MTRHAEAVAPVRSSGPVAGWVGRHVSTSRESFARLLRQPFASLMIMLVIAVTLALPAALNLVVKNVAALSGSWDDALDFSVFLEDGLAASQAEALSRLIEQRADVDTVRLVTAEQALEEFKVESGFGAALDQLTSNPLPHTLIVRPAAANTAASMALLKEELSNLPETELVQIDTEWVQRFHAILDIIRQAIAAGAALLGIAIVVVIGNTIRLEIENRRDEILVTKLIGASNGFVRRPFLWSGFWYGLFGALLALGLVQFGLFSLRPTVARLAGLYRGDISVLALDLGESAAILGIGVALGLLGSWFAVARHLSAIEPR